jgi:hypothetical protein
MEITNDINKIRSLAQIFSTANFKKIVREEDYFDTFYRIDRYAKVKESTTNLQVIDQVYKSLLNNYKNEYVYKNILINKLLIKKYSLKNTIALNEFKIGNSIADFVLLNGEARVYEIKTELDGLDKLDKQLSDYEKFADKIYIVASSKHIPSLLMKYYNSNIGIVELTQRNALKTIKEAKKNTVTFKHDTLFKTLRKDEYISLIKSYFKFVPNVPNTQIFRECIKMSKKIDILEFQKLVVQKLKFRNISNPEVFKERQIPESLKHICYSLDFSDVEYQQLDYFLSQKSKICISRMLEVNNLS